MEDRVPYTYLIGWSNHNKYYYGVRYGANCHPRDLWVTYFTSSKSVEFYRKKFGDPDIVQIRKTFENIDEARIWETRVLQKMDVINDDRFLNKTTNISIDPNAAMIGSLKSTNRGQKRPHLSALNKKRTGKNNHMWKIGKNHPFYGKTGKDAPNYGKPQSEHQKQKASERINCPHCDKTGNKSNMIRWHFNNCKQNKKEKKYAFMG